MTAITWVPIAWITVKLDYSVCIIVNKEFLALLKVIPLSLEISREMRCLDLGVRIYAMQSSYNRANDMAGRVATDSYNGWCHRHQNRRLCSRPHSHKSVIFFVFLAFILFTLRPLCWIYEYACNELMQRWLWGRIGLCPHGVTTQVMLGVSLRARRDTTQVMLGVSLRARRDTTLVLWNESG